MNCRGLATCLAIFFRAIENRDLSCCIGPRAALVRSALRVQTSLDGGSLHSESHALKRLMSQKYARSNPPTTMRPAANRDLYRQRKPHAATRSPMSDIAVQNRFDGKSTQPKTNDRNRIEPTAPITSGRIRARCMKLELSRRISITVPDAKQKRGMLIRTSAAVIALIGRGSIMSLSQV